jgi:hypothetical protein
MVVDSYSGRPPKVIGVVATLLAVACACGGCAVDDRGFVACRWYTSETGWVVTVEAWGIHFVTNPGDAGVIIGQSERLYCFPKPSKQPDAPDWRVDLLAALRSDRLALAEVTDKDAHPRLSDLGPPLAVVSRDAGVMFRCSAHDAGITIGLRRHAAVHWPANVDGVLVLAVDPDVPESTQFHWKGVLP